jgi:hypothetical protein
MTQIMRELQQTSVTELLKFTAFAFVITAATLGAAYFGL